MVEDVTTNLEVEGSNPVATRHLEKMAERKKFVFDPKNVPIHVIDQNGFKLMKPKYNLMAP